MAELVTHIARVVELQAVNSQWRDLVKLAPGFAEDVARNAVTGVLDLVDEAAVKRNAATHGKG